MSADKPQKLTLGHEGSTITDALRKGTFRGVIVIDAESRKAGLSPEAAEILGLAAQVELDTLPARLLALVREAWSAAKPLATRRIEFNLANRTPFALEVSTACVPTGGTTCSLVLVLRDATSGFSDHFRQLDRLANIGILAASMAHEIKNALVAGKTFIELLLEKQKETELVEVVRRELGRIDTIVSRMLRFAGPARQAFTKVSLHEVLDHSLKLVQSQLHSKFIALERSFAAPQDLVSGHDYELQQAFVNLLLNAVEAMGGNGALKIRTDLVPAPACESDRLDEGPAAPSIRICIEDTGPGIPPENLSRLFEPFFTTKSEGTGLGLAITRRIIQEHQGTITLESQLGQGTTFEICLPLAT